MSTGTIKRGIISGYDSKSMTAVITSYEGDVYSDVVCPIEKFDIYNSAFSVKPPSVGSPCLYTIVGEEVFLITMFPPGNVLEESTQGHDNPYDNYINRAPANAKKGVLPGEATNVNALGGEESFTDTCKKIIMSPGKLQTVWNIANFTWDTVCNLLNLRSCSMDINCNTTAQDTTTTTFNFKRTVGESPAVVNINIGTIEGSTDIIVVKINDKEFLQIDPERNVKLMAKNIDVLAEDININANNFNCLNVDRVDLP